MKLMIIDDDDQIREGMVWGIQWENFGFEKAEGFKNGKEALDRLEKEAFDIVISDISMPVMSGIELMKLTREKYPSVRFILISGYKEFEYAQAGIRYGADGYILKPIHLDELIDIVTNVIKKIDKCHEDVENQSVVKELERNQVMKQVIQEKISDSQDIMGFLKDACGFERIHVLVGGVIQDDLLSSCLGIEESFRMLVTNKITEFLAGYTYSIFYMDSNEIFILADVVDSSFQIFHLQMQMRKILEEINREFADKSFSMGISGMGYLTDIPRLYKGAVNALNERFFYGDQSFLVDKTYKERIGTIRCIEEEQWNERIMHCIEKRGEEELNQVIRECRDVLFHNDKQAIQKYILRNMVQVSGKYKEEIQEERIRKAVYDAKNFDEMLTIWEAFLMDVMKRMINEQKYSRDICSAIDYIHVHYMEKLTSDRLADELGISAGHFSRIFKQQVGIPFVKYVNQFRIDQAEELLIHTHLKVYEVAEQVGIPDYIYFTQVFKSIKGKAPTELRKN